jgi:hypothetical protein
MSSRAKLALLALFLVVLFAGIAVFAANSVYAGGFALLSDSVEVAGKLCTSGCTMY